MTLNNYIGSGLASTEAMACLSKEDLFWFGFNLLLNIKEKRSAFWACKIQLKAFIFTISLMCLVSFPEGSPSFACTLCGLTQGNCPFSGKEEKLFEKGLCCHGPCCWSPVLLPFRLNKTSSHKSGRREQRQHQAQLPLLGWVWSLSAGGTATPGSGKYTPSSD